MHGLFRIYVAYGWIGPDGEALSIRTLLTTDLPYGEGDTRVMNFYRSDSSGQPLLHLACSLFWKILELASLSNSLTPIISLATVILCVPMG